MKRRYAVGDGLVLSANPPFNYQSLMVEITPEIWGHLRDYGTTYLYDSGNSSV